MENQELKKKKKIKKMFWKNINKFIIQPTILGLVMGTAHLLTLTLLKRYFEEK